MNSIDDTGRRQLAAAVRSHQAGRLREAAAAYEALLGQTPNDPDLLQRLGVALAQMGRHEDGARLLGRSLELQPDRPAVLLNLARALHALGQEAAALGSCTRALQLDQSLVGGYRLRSNVLLALGRREEALANSGEAVRLAPREATAHADLGVALEAVGRFQDAFDSFDRALVLDPRLAEAHHNYGLLAARRGLHERALQSFDRALALQPQAAALHSNRGNALQALGRLDDAVQSFSTALAIEPGNAATLHNRAVALALLGRHAEALRDYDELLARHGPNGADLVGRGAALVALRREAEALPALQDALTMLPDEAEAHIQLGVAQLRLDRNLDAVASFDRALTLRPDVPEVLNNRAIALAALGRMDEALDTLRRVLSLNGGAPDTHTNVGIVQKAMGRHANAELHFDQALAVRPGDAAATFEKGFLYLTQGDFKRGWPLYEARFDVPALANARRQFDLPRWDGSQAIAGKTLLVYAEQGLGDAIQFCRYLALLTAQGATVIFEVPPPLQALMHTLPEAIQVVARGAPAPAADFQVPLLSLPLAYGTELASIPAAVPYLAADPARRAVWAPRIAALPGLRVGIAWQGNPDVERLIWARGRSMPLAAFAPLAAMPSVSLVSLQRGDGAEQLPQAAFRDSLLDLGPEFDRGPQAFLDTAAAMTELDLIITTDTSIAHLAGALGRPVWTLLHGTPDWRWLLQRDDSPWYPTMRLFRQGDGGWDTLMRAVAEALAQTV